MKLKHFNILVKPTNDCNINCKYCFDRNMRNKLHGTRMSKEDIGHIVDLLSKFSEETAFIWHGGEPTLMGKSFYEDVQKYFYIHYNSKFEQTMQTNGVNLFKDSEWLDVLDDNAIKFGLSYDILSQETRTTAYEYGDFVKELVHQNKVNGAITVVNNSNIHKLIDIYQFAKTELGSDYTLCFNPVFKTEDTEENNMEVSIEHFSREFRKFIEINILDTDYNAITERTTEQYLGMLFGKRDNLTCDFSDCRGGWLCVVANGDMYPCDRAIEKYNLGNIKECTDLLTVLNSDKYSEYVNDVQYRLDTHCYKCDYYQYCNGGCNSRHAYSGTNPSARNLNKQLCDEYKSLLNATYLTIQSVPSIDYINRKYHNIITSQHGILPKQIGDFLSNKLHKQVDLTLHVSIDTNLAEISVISTPQFKLFKLFNLNDSKHGNTPTERMDYIFNTYSEDILKLLDTKEDN